MRIRAAQVLLSCLGFIIASAAAADTPPGCTGDVLATYHGVPAHSNAPYQGGFDTCGPYGPDGWQYTCVEYVRRFYRVVFGIDTSIANGWSGDAKDFYPPAGKKDLIGFKNGATTVAPAPDDILVFGRSVKDSKGHVAIVTAVNGNQVSLAEENYPLRFPPTVTLSHDPATGFWSIAPRQGLPVKGWLRLKRPVGSGPTFGSKFDRPTGTEPLGLAVTDFDGDGRTDIAVGIYNHGSGDHLTIFRNTGSIGQLQFDPLPVDILTGRGPEGIAAGDLNNDGKIDLVTVNPGDSSMSVLRNFSTRGFIDFEPVPLTLPSPPTPHRLVIADFDGDGMPDLIVTSNNGRFVSVFHHVSSPNTIAFDYRRDYGVNDYLNDLTVADIDRDTRPEVLIPRTDSGFLTIFQNTSSPGDVQAAAQPPLAAGVPPIRGIAVGDLNNDPDHALDVVIAAIGGVGVFQNSSSPGVFDLPRTDVPTGTNPDAVAIGDLDKDGLADVVAANPDEDTLSILHNRSTGRPIVLTPLEQRPETGMTPITLALEDVDGDGWLDIVVANHEGNSVSVLLNTTGKQ